MFCAIVAGDSPATFVPSEIRGVVAFHPLGPVTPGHLLFVPRTHIVDAAQDAGITGMVFAAASLHAAAQKGPFNLITSAGVEATQSIMHFHAHYVPRSADDQLMLPWSPRVT